MTVAAPRIAPSTDASEALDRRLKALFDGEAALRSVAEDAALLETALRAAQTARPAEPLCAERRRLEAALGRGFPVAA